MAITYKKPLKTIVITTIGGTALTVADTATDAVASKALAEFESFKTMHFTISGTAYAVPFHAVDHIEITVAESENITKEDPYCDED